MAVSMQDDLDRKQMMLASAVDAQEDGQGAGPDQVPAIETAFWERGMADMTALL